MAARYSHNYEAFGEQVLRGPAIKANLKARAERVKAQFEATAPVGEPFEDDDHIGRYKDSATIEEGTETIVIGERAFARVVVGDPDAMSIEYGHAPRRKDGKPGKHVEGSYTLTKALRAARDE